MKIKAEIGMSEFHQSLLFYICGEGKLYYVVGGNYYHAKNIESGRLYETPDENGNVGCVDCVGCENCVGCVDCENCSNCKACKSCFECFDCNSCDTCKNSDVCNNCICCAWCNNSAFDVCCAGCHYCNDCTGCDACYCCLNCYGMCKSTDAKDVKWM